MRRSPTLRISLVLLASALAGCKDGTGPGGGRFIRLSGVGGVTDTVDAVLQPVLIEVHDASGGRPPAGTALGFKAINLSIGQLSPASYPEFQPGVTNDAGKSGLAVRLGEVPGPAQLVVSVPTLGVEDTVRFTVQPGRPAKVVIAPAESTTYVGRTYTLRGGATDRHGNALPDPVAWSTASSGITIAAGGVITTTALGRFPFTGTLAGTPGFSGWVNVVPSGRFAAAGAAITEPGFAVLGIDADGSNRSTLVAGLTPGTGGIHPTWISGTGSVVYSAVTSTGVQMLFVVSPDAALKPFLASPPASAIRQSDPVASADGKWVFFSAIDTQCPTVPTCMARARSDGTGYQMLPVVASIQPAPSPDGSKVAFTTGAGPVRVLDIATGGVSTWSVPGIMPAWSPDGTRIAYRNTSGSVSIVNADGSGDHVLTTLAALAPPFWSPDSKWVVVPQGVNASLVDATTASTIPLNYFITAVPGSWR